MTDRTRLQLSLLLLRLGVFIVMAIWTIDKFANPSHAAGIFEKFYAIPGVGSMLVWGLGILEGVLIIAFVAGLRKRLTYGLVMVLHGVSTFSAFRQYLTPFEGTHLLFFAAWPMLAACIALYLLRDQDRMLSFTSSQRS